METVHRLIGSALVLKNSMTEAARDQRGLSQSTEQAILLAGVVAIAIGIVTLITGFVNGKLAGIG
ncbi:hypothetical protein [Propioniciclava soli]|uniref:hypothetical protein n=1 Tax=Propioniciclava soli TaxID=2775081 RepID=UPI001E526981|nr:hypothetical protein [Propioniciclava soli]